jgi:Uncharacterized protein conserved in bacteria
MVVGVLTLRLHLPMAASLKDKRAVLRSLTGRIQNKFPVSVAEVGAQNAHQSAVLAVACVAANTALADRVLDKLIALVEMEEQSQLCDILREYR